MGISVMLKKIWILLSITPLFFLSHSETFYGRVVDEEENGIEDAEVVLVTAGKSTFSDEEGNWSFTITSGVVNSVRSSFLSKPVFKNNSLFFLIKNASQKVNISVFSINGKLIYNALDKKVAAGFYRFDPIKPSLSTNTYAVRLQIDSETYFFRMPVIKGLDRTGVSLKQESKNMAGTKRLLKTTAVTDTVKVSKSGYESVSKPINNYEDSVIVTLKTYTPEYHMNPPDPCYNQFNVDDCTPGDPQSACGGNCRSANSCSPPEDQNKSDLPKTFICPRFMLFSNEMVQAAIDDANLYGWNEQDLPFNYAIVGHDPDIDGLDDTTSSCCQCYQLIFVNPEPSSPQPPDLPYPKPLIVQSFNTAASGPKGFDVFMGAGGYGAFNSCYDDPEFDNTTNFDEFLYDEYPYQNPESGGISFLRFEECTEGWPVLADTVGSDACQQKIEEMCNQALNESSQSVTENTRQSCIKSNMVNSLYHQNWDVMVKRVRCPDNLTRVTGCRLVEDNLPMPDPDVQNPDDASSDGSFSEGYHTTTMEDCCKPTCAWSDWVEDYGLPVDGEWNSFYSCDKNGVPITK